MWFLYYTAFSLAVEERWDGNFSQSHGLFHRCHPEITMRICGGQINFAIWANVEAGNQEQLMIKDLVESYSLSIGQVRNYGVVCAVSTLENIYERFGYHVLDRTLRLCVGTWEGDMNSLSANMLNGIARLVYTFGDALKDETFKEKVGEMSVKLLSRTAKERRPGSMGYAEAMLLAYNRKCKYPLKWTKLYEKNVGNNEGLDIDTDMDEDGGEDSFEGVAKE